MRTAFVNGGLAIVVCYWEQHGEEVEGGARVELRYVTEVPSHRPVPGTQGFTVEPVSAGGIWRADLFVILTGGGRSCFHFHPAFENDDVGEREHDDLLTQDPRRWIALQLQDLTALLERSEAADLLPTIDFDEHARALPLMLASVDAALSRATVAVASRSS